MSKAVSDATHFNLWPKLQGLDLSLAMSNIGWRSTRAPRSRLHVAGIARVSGVLFPKNSSIVRPPLCASWLREVSTRIRGLIWPRPISPPSWRALTQFLSKYLPCSSLHPLLFTQSQSFISSFIHSFIQGTASWKVQLCRYLLICVYPCVLVCFELCIPSGHIKFRRDQ